MEKYKSKVKQVVDYPRCWIYRELIQRLTQDQNIRTSGGSGLFHYVALCSYVNFRAQWLQADQVREDKLKPYLGAIARNKARERLRKQGQDLPLEDDLLLLAPEDPERELVEREQAAFLRETLLALPHPDRDIFFRYYYDCQPVKQIAQAPGLNPATVKTKLHRGRKKLKEVLTKVGYPIEDQNF